MTITRCISSHIMTEELRWRNPQGAEVYWYSKGPQEGRDWLEHAQRVISTECSLIALIVISSVETVAYASLTLLSVALYPCTDKPFIFFVKLLESSSFTIVWGLANALFLNFARTNVLTHESYARYEASQFFGIEKLYRPEDRKLVENNQVQRRRWNKIETKIETVPLSDLLLNAGASFMRQDVLADVSEETLRLFKAGDKSVRDFILGKAVNIYAFGARKNEEIPDFFKQAIKDYILSLREQTDPTTEEEFQRLAADRAQFNVEEQSATAQSILFKLQELLSDDQLDPLIDACWGKTVVQLNQQ